MTRRDFLSLAPAAALQRRPTNVVFFMTDDHGAWALGSGGCTEMHTPSLDRLSAEGTRFRRAYACTPVCSPSRATYYTGKLPSHHGVQDFLLADDSYGPESRPFLDGQVTFADVLKANGYTCGLVGKWHLGEDDRAQAGFDYWHTAGRGGGTYLNAEFFVNDRTVRDTGYKTDFVGDGAIDFLDRHHGGPFCLVVPFFAPHSPYDYQPERYRRHYEGSDFSCFPRTDPHPQGRGRFREHFGNEESYRSYSALVTGMDANVGRVLEKLDELDVRANTLVVFSADQGFNCGHHGVWGKGNGTIPFNMYEESIQVPLIWNHPAVIPAGTETPAMVSSYDFFPTLLDYLEIETEVDPQRIGRSYAGLVRGNRLEWPNEVFFEYGYTRAVRTEHLKYIERSDGWPNELFDLEEDPGERINRVGKPEYREMRLALRNRLRAFFDEADAPALPDWRSTTRQRIPTDTGYYRWQP
ncbi:MAG: sulfatase-like hydrolase/transferase [Bryobacterales bacterium]|nr:sulfatase-like hydrolase/transferase [Bryobacterales bacterium]